MQIPERMPGACNLKCNWLNASFSVLQPYRSLFQNSHPRTGCSLQNRELSHVCICALWLPLPLAHGTHAPDTRGYSLLPPNLLIIATFVFCLQPLSFLSMKHSLCTFNQQFYQEEDEYTAKSNVWASIY